eukprot:6558855-Heterocapsa_arctica.AAC.1
MSMQVQGHRLSPELLAQHVTISTACRQLGHGALDENMFEQVWHLRKVRGPEGAKPGVVNDLFTVFDQLGIKWLSPYVLTREDSPNESQGGGYISHARDQGDTEGQLGCGRDCQERQLRAARGRGPLYLISLPAQVREEQADTCHQCGHAQMGPGRSPSHRGADAQGQHERVA